MKTTDAKAKVAVGAAVLVVAAATWAVIPERDRSLPPPPKLEDGPHLFLLGKDGELWRVDLTGDVVHAKFPELDPGDPAHFLLARGRTLVGWGRSETYLLDPTLEERPEVLVEGTVQFLPSPHEDRVWAMVEDDGPVWVAGQIEAVREVDVGGRVTVRDVPLPEGAWPQRAVSAGLVFFSGPKRIVWDPSTGAVVHTFQTPGDLGPTHGNLVAWGEFGGRELHVTDVSSGEDTEIAPPPGSRKFRIWEGAFSPDGGTIAVPVVPGASRKRVQLALVDVAAGSAQTVAGTVTGEAFNFVTWSATGGHVFFTGVEGEERRIFVYEPGAPAATLLRAAVGDFYDADAI